MVEIVTSEAYDRRLARKAYDEAMDFHAKRVTGEPLHESGRHFVDGRYDDLTKCHHGDTGEYQNESDGRIIAALWNAWRLGILELRPEQ